MVEASRTDSGLTWANGASSITDSAFTTADIGKMVTGAGIRASTYVGSTSTAGVIKLVTLPVGGTTQTTSAAESAGQGSVTLVGETYKVTVKAPDGTAATGSPLTMIVTPGGVEYGSTFYASGTSIPFLIA
jgi:hypothetical protein